MTTTIKHGTVTIQGHAGVRLEKYGQLFGVDALNVIAFDAKKDTATFKPLSVELDEYMKKRAE